MVLCEVKQVRPRKINTLRFHSHVKPKKYKQTQMNNNNNKRQNQTYKEHTDDCQREMGGKDRGKMGEEGWKIQASSYGMNNSWE